MALFAHLADDTFQLFTGRMRHLYAAAIREVYREFYSGATFASPFREDVVQFLTRVVRDNAHLWADEETQRNLPPPPGRRGRRRLQRMTDDGQAGDALVGRARHVYARLHETGWLEEEEWGFYTQVEMPPAGMALADTLVQIEEGLDQLFAGVMAEIRASMNAIEKGDERSLLALPKARDTAVAFVRRLRGIKSQLRYVRRALMQSENLEERLDCFFDAFVQQIVITDFANILTTDHPSHHRHDILRSIEAVRDDDTRLQDLATKYMDAALAGTYDDAHARVVEDLNGIEDTLEAIVGFMTELNQFRAHLEEKLRNTVYYMDRADDRRSADLLDIARRLDAIDRRAQDHGDTPDPVPCNMPSAPRLWSADLLAEPRAPRPEVSRQTVKKRKPDPALALYKQLARRFAEMFAPRSDTEIRRFLEQRVPDRLEARDVRLETLEDFLLFDEVRRRRMHSTRLLGGQFTVQPADGHHDSRWLRCRNFRIVRHDHPADGVRDA